MIYALKFGASFLLPPGIFIFGFILVGCLLLKKREVKFGSAVLGISLLFYLCSTNIVSSLLLGSLEHRYEVPHEIQGDVIVMLGGGATSDTTDLDGLGNLGDSASNRLLTAARLQKSLGVPILLSGGQVYADSGKEAYVAKRMLVGLGISEDKIILEDKSLNTKQNAQYTAKILQERGLRNPILVTSAFHMERSVLNFQKVGVEVLPVPAGYSVNKKQSFHYNKLAPSDGALQDTTTFLREWLGILVARYIW